jgi:hypothetical protein
MNSESGIEVLHIAIYLSALAPLLTAILLGMAWVHGHSRRTIIIYYVLAIPALYGLAALWFAWVPNPFGSYLWYATFVTIMFLYLSIARWVRPRRR